MNVGHHPRREKARPTSFFSCIGKDRACGNAALDEELLCGPCRDRGDIRITRPSRVLVRAHFNETSKYGQTIVNILEDSGIRVVRRTKERQRQLDEHRKLLEGGVRVFGVHDLRPLVAIEDAIQEMGPEGYSLSDLHILDLDDVLEGTSDEEEKKGKRIVVFHYDYTPGRTSLEIPEYGNEVLARPFLGCRVWVNLRDPATGALVHCVELIGFQFKEKARLRLKFARSVWGFEDTTDYTKEEKIAE